MKRARSRANSAPQWCDASTQRTLVKACTFKAGASDRRSTLRAGPSLDPQWTTSGTPIVWTSDPRWPMDGPWRSGAGGVGSRGGGGGGPLAFHTIDVFLAHTDFLCAHTDFLCVEAGWSSSTSSDDTITGCTLFVGHMAPVWLPSDSLLALGWLPARSRMAPCSLPYGSRVAPVWLLHGSRMAPVWLPSDSLLAPWLLGELERSKGGLGPPLAPLGTSSGPPSNARRV